MAAAPSNRSAVPPAPLVALAGWVLPGSGYWLIGQRARGTTIGVSVLALFVMGLLIGGVRVIEVPGYNSDTGRRVVDATTGVWALQATPINELRNKPWSVPQAMTGPVALAAGAWSVAAAAGQPNGPKGYDGTPARFKARNPNDWRQGQAEDPVGAATHARVNEIGSLYLSVAGLLNLMAIIDAAHRSVHLAERRRTGGGEPADEPVAGVVA